jgi:hypothetical protein
VAAEPQATKLYWRTIEQIQGRRERLNTGEHQRLVRTFQKSCRDRRRLAQYHGDSLIRGQGVPFGPPWRATLLDAAQPGAHQHFATLDALFAFLTAQTDPVPPLAREPAPIDWE